MFTIEIDKDSGLPLYIQLKDQILFGISTANLPAGTILPSIRRLSSELGIATATVRHAYRVLESDGIVETRQGKGIMVAELDGRSSGREGDSLTPASQEQVVNLFTSAIARAYALGASSKEIRSAVSQAFSRRIGRPSVIFVGAEPEFIDHYVPLLQEAFDDLPIDLHSMLVEEDNRTLVRRIEEVVRPLCVVTLVRSFSTVRSELEHTEIPVIAMALNLSDETKQYLIDLTPPEKEARRIVLVSERINELGAYHLIEQYVGAERLPERVSLDSPELPQILQSADVALHTLRARRKVAELAGPDCQLIEIRFLPDSISLSRIRQQVESRLSNFVTGEPMKTAGLAQMMSANAAKWD